MRISHRSCAGFPADVRIGMCMSVRISARLRMHIPAQKHRCEGAYPRALLDGLRFPMERIEEMSAERAEGISPGSTATSCTASSSTARFRARGPCGAGTHRSMMGEGHLRCAGAGLRPHRDRSCRDALGGRGDASPLRRMLRDQRHREAPARPVPRCRFPFGKPRAAAPAPSLAGASILRKDTHGPNVPGQRNGASRWTDESSRSC